MSDFTQLSNWCVPTSGYKFRTTKEVSWEIGKVGSGLWIRVPPGYVFDVSVPKTLTWLLKPDDTRFRKAACLHDYALEVMRWDRVTSAAAFAEALRANDVGPKTRLAMVLSVITWNWS